MKTIRAKAATKATPSKKSAPEPTSSELTFHLVNETKGALRYEEEGFQKDNMDATMIGTLYLRKAHVDGTPKSVTITINY